MAMSKSMSVCDVGGILLSVPFWRLPCLAACSSDGSSDSSRPVTRINVSSSSCIN